MYMSLNIIPILSRLLITITIKIIKDRLVNIIFYMKLKKLNALT